MSTVVLVALTLHSPAPTSAQTSRIEVSPASLELLEGESQVVQLSLGEPIISADLEPGFVTVTFSPSAPELVNLSSSSVTWPAADWHTVREITVTALDDGDYARAGVLIAAMRPFEDLRALENNGTNVTVVKAALRILGPDCGATRPPSAWPLTPSAQEQLVQFMDSAALLR